MQYFEFCTTAWCLLFQAIDTFHCSCFTTSILKMQSFTDFSLLNSMLKVRTSNSAVVLLRVFETLIVDDPLPTLGIKVQGWLREVFN